MKWKNSRGLSSEELRSVRMKEKACREGRPVTRVVRPPLDERGRLIAVKRVILEKREEEAPNVEQPLVATKVAVATVPEAAPSLPAEAGLE